MAFVLQKDSHESKGILIIKHLEYRYLESLTGRKIQELSKRYFIGLYFGFYTIRKSDFMFVDFYVGEDGVVDIPNSVIPRLNLNGYNFQPPAFFARSVSQKKFDFIFIGDPSRRKRLKFLLRNLERAMRQEDFRVLIINRTKSANLYLLLLNLLVRQKLRNLPDAIRRKITYIEADQSLGMPIPRDVIPFFLESSKCLIIPSLAEGAARVVAEAMSKGLSIISYADMQGATNNHLCDDYDMLFRTSRELESCMVNFVRNYQIKYIHNTRDVSHLFSEEVSKKKFKEFLIGNLPDFSLDEANWKSISLVNSLQSHNAILPRVIPSNPRTDECQSYDSFYRLYSHLVGHEANVLIDFALRIKTFFRDALGIVLQLFGKLKI